MLPCCKYTYVKFRNADGTVNEKALRKWATSTVPDLQVEGVIEKVKRCNCRCHVIGEMVIH